MKPTFSVLHSILWAGLFLLLSDCSLGYQNDPAPPTTSDATTPVDDKSAPPQGDDKSALEKYLALKRQIAENKTKITQLLIKTPTAKTDLQKQVLSEIDEIKKNLAVWENQLSELVIDAYCASPDSNRELAQEMNRRLRVFMGEDQIGGNFNPRRALDLVEKIHASGSRNPQIMMIGCQAAYACLEFELCDKYLQSMEEGGAKLSEAYRENLAKAKQAWEIEQGYLAKDANLPVVEIETSIGKFTVELYEEQAPHAVNNFVSLCESGFFKNQPFFFVKSGQVAMSGCPTGDGKGNAGYFIPDEFSREDARKHGVGTLSLIHDRPGESSSQFAISSQPTPERDGKFTVFGRVIDGIEIVFKMPNFNPSMKAGREPVRILSTNVLQKRSHPYEVLEKIEIKSTGNSSTTNKNPPSNLVDKKK
jgi:cyclophilin family peptidyl-prolyl cis-trans isomerase